MAPAAEAAQTPNPAPRPGPPLRVLLVDDSRMQRRILSSSLLRWGYEVREAASGEEALALCRSDPPDLVVSDWVMPGMSGPELCRAVRGLAGDAYSYFILLTSKSEKDEVARGLDSGADDFLTKPVNNGELRARITAGERIIEMQRELTEKNRLISDTLAELQRIHDGIESDLREAKKLQQSLLRERHRRFDKGVLSLLLRSSGHVGGDLVGFFPAGPGQLALYAIDVSGHGISSALMTARLAGYLSGSAPDQNVALHRLADGSYAARPPDQVISTLNDLVLNEMETDHFFTMLLALVDLDTGRVTVAQAGHPHPAIQRADGRIEQIGTGGFPVGLVAGVAYDLFEITLTAGDRLLILSDGVTECPGGCSGEMLSEDGLARIMAELRGLRGNDYLEALTWKLADFAGQEGFPDDVSGILFEYGPTDSPA